MVKLDRYIGVTVFVTVLAVFGVVLGLALLLAFIDEFNGISASYGTGDVPRFIFLTAPWRAYDMLPMVVLISYLVGLGTLASNSELIVMCATGVSLSRIIWAVMKPMLVLTLAGILVGECVAPWIKNIVQSGRVLAQGGGDPQSFKHGLWHRQGREYIYINAVQPNGVLYGMARYRFGKQHGLESASLVRHARFETDHWQLEEVTTTLLHPRGKYSEMVKPPTERWDVQLSPQLLNTVVMEPEALSISGLWQYIHCLADQGLNNNRYQLTFWIKVLQPLVTAALMLMAISSIFGLLRPMTLGQWTFTGALVGFVLHIAQDLLGPSSPVFDFPPLLAVVIPVSICALAGVWLLCRMG